MFIFLGILYLLPLGVWAHPEHHKAIGRSKFNSLDLPLRLSKLSTAMALGQSRALYPRKEPCPDPTKSVLCEEVTQECCPDGTCCQAGYDCCGGGNCCDPAGTGEDGCCGN
jgi:hypothetical protein